MQERDLPLLNDNIFEHSRAVKWIDFIANLIGGINFPDAKSLRTKWSTRAKYHK